jgi:hypothetical protein
MRGSAPNIAESVRMMTGWRRWWCDAIIRVRCVGTHFKREEPAKKVEKGKRAGLRRFGKSELMFSPVLYVPSPVSFKACRAMHSAVNLISRSERESEREISRWRHASTDRGGR